MKFHLIVEKRSREGTQVSGSSIHCDIMHTCMIGIGSFRKQHQSLDKK